MLTMNEIRKMVISGNNSFIGQRLIPSEMEGFYRSNENELESGNWVECEGGRELVVNNEGVILYYEGYYEEIR